MKNKLLDMREYFNVNQETIGEIVGVTKTSISKWETGKETIPLKHLNTLSNYYNVSIDYLVGLSKIKNYENYIKINELNKIEIGKRIKLFRNENELSLRELANILNTTSSTISAYETGKTLILTSFAYQICKEYHISLDYLCGKLKNKMHYEK